MTTEENTDHDSAFGKAIAKGVLIGLPTVLVFLTVVIWLVTDNDLADSFATAVLPGVLLGVFGGGFVGVVAASD